MKYIYMFRFVFFTVIFVVFCTVSVYAQILPPPPPGPGAPLDPLSWIILGAGGALAGKRYIESRKKKKGDNSNL